jgi:hypothetical protein
VVDALPVVGLAGLGTESFDSLVESRHLVLGGGLGTYDRALTADRDLYRNCLAGLSGIGLLGYLDVDPDDSLVVLLELGELLFDMTAEPVRHLTVPAFDHDLHAASSNL